MVQLHEALGAAGVQVVPFSWRSGLFGRYDVFHTHWPEILVHGNGRARTRARQALTAALVARLRMTRTPVVRTVHNVRPHEAVRDRAGAAVLASLERRESWWVRLNDHTPVADLARSTTAPLGHYLAWAAGRTVPDQVPGRLVSPGVVRRYKGLEELLAGFARVPGPTLSVHVVGRPEDQALARRLQDLATLDTRVVLRLEHLDDDELAGAVGESQLTVLPHPRMHNSSALLLALSLARPVLVPSLPVTEALADRIGRDWVLTADLSGPAEMAAAITVALRRTATPPVGVPDLAAHDWDRVAASHVTAYRSALDARRGGAS